MTPPNRVTEIVEEANYLFPTLAQGIEKVGDNGVPYVSDKTGLDWLRSALSQARQEGYKEGVESRQGEIDFLRHEAYGDALTTEGK